MRLIIDIGNSKVKYYCQKKQIAKIGDLEFVAPAGEIVEIFAFSTVPKITEREISKVREKLELMAYEVKVHQFDIETDSKLKNLYPTIGPDRAVKLEAALNSFAGENVVLMDFGSATTMSVANKNYEFLGGFISEGFGSSLKTLSKCSQIPDLRRELDVTDFSLAKEIATNSKDAILHGAYLAHLALVEKWQAMAAEKLGSDNFKSICTGGLAGIFKEKFDVHIPASELLDAF